MEIRTTDVKSNMSLLTLLFAIKVLAPLNPIPGRLFQTFEMQGEDFLARVRKTAIKAVYFIQITWNLVQHIFGLIHVIKMMMSAIFLMMSSFKNNFLSYFQIFPLPKVNWFSLKSNDLNVCIFWWHQQYTKNKEGHQ